MSFQIIGFDFFYYFFFSVHQNYVGTDVDREPFLLSVVVTDVNNHNVQQYRAILWCKSVSWFNRRDIPPVNIGMLQISYVMHFTDMALHGRFAETTLLVICE